MSITRERFEQGMTYEDYKAQMTRNRERLEENERIATLPPEDVRFFAELPQPLQVLVITEDWCEPAITSIPVLGRLAAESGKLNLRVFLRDENPDVMDQYLKEGIHGTIPTYAFFRHDFRELGQWRERPALIGQMVGAMTSELFATDPAFADIVPGTPIPQLPEAARMRMIQALVTFGEENRELATREFLREIRELVERGLRELP